MAEYTELQVRHYAGLFHRFAGTTGGSSRYLTRSDLFRLMPLLGPEMSLEDVQRLILMHDRECVGTLDLDDFLEMLSEYELRVGQEESQLQSMLRAFRHLQSKLPQGVRLEREKFADILKAGNNDMPKEETEKILNALFTKDGSLLNETELRERMTVGLAWVRPVAPPSHLSSIERTLHIKIYHASKLGSVLREKIRKGKSIQYSSIDPFVQVSCSGITAETNVLIDSVTPEWNQELTLRIRLPSSDINETNHWLMCQPLRFSLFDMQSTGITPHSEWLCSASVSLATVFADAALGPASYLLKMYFPGVLLKDEDEPLLDVSIKVNTDGVTEHRMWSETVYLNRYSEKIRRDMKVVLEEEEHEELYDYYTSFYRTMRKKFRRRNFQIMAPDENNTFRPLFSFIHPMIPSTASDATPTELAKLVALIPSPQAAIPFRPPILYSYQIASPPLVLLRRRATALEHSILLCSFFLRVGIDSFVCMGKAFGNQLHSWVVTLEEIKEDSKVTGKKDVKGKRKKKEIGRIPTLVPETELDSENSLSQTSIPIPTTSPQTSPRSWANPEEFRHKKTNSEVEKKRKRVRATHWETTTGESFTYGQSADRPFPFERIACVFNSDNIWVNNQPSDFVGRTSWIISDSTDWQPFLTRDQRERLHFPNWYAVPEFELPDPMCTNILYTREFVQRMVSLIQGYRRHYLYIPITKFHRKLNILVQNILEADVGKIANCSTNRVYLSTVEEDTQFSELKSRIDSLVPPRFIWNAHFYRFDEPDIEDIVLQLAWTGILDNSVVDVIYFVGGVVHPLPWGLRSIWVMVGYLYPVESEI